MSGKASRRKGSRLEYDIASLYVKHGIDDKATRMPMSGADKYLKGDIRHAHNVAIPFRFIDECKNQESVNWFKWWQQAQSQCSIGEEPVLHFTKNYSETFTLVKTDTWFTILGEIVRLYNQKELRGEMIVEDSQDTKKSIWQLKQAKEFISKAINILNKEI